MEQFLVFKAHRLVYHSTLGMRVTKKKKVEGCHLLVIPNVVGAQRVTHGRRVGSGVHLWFMVYGLWFMIFDVWFMV